MVIACFIAYSAPLVLSITIECQHLTAYLEIFMRKESVSFSLELSTQFSFFCPTFFLLPPPSPPSAAQMPPQLSNPQDPKIVNPPFIPPPIPVLPLPFHPPLSARSFFPPLPSPSSLLFPLHLTRTPTDPHKPPQRKTRLGRTQSAVWRV